MDFESLSGLPVELQLKVLLAALETSSVDNYRIGQIFCDTGSEVARRFLDDHEHTNARIKDRILLLFTENMNSNAKTT